MASKPGLLQVIQSVLASAFGVQSHKNYQKDFSQPDVQVYITVGVVFVILFVLSLIALVQFILT